MASDVDEWWRWVDHLPSPLVLDGGLGDLLTRRGHDLHTGSLWSARLLVTDPSELSSVAALWLHAGADLLSTATYQASAHLLRADFALSPAAIDSVFRTSAHLLHTAIRRHRHHHRPPHRRRIARVAASMGPYSAVLPGTDEYSGEYPDVPRAHLLSFHAARCALFDRLPPDQAPHVYCFETIGNPDEARAIVDVMAHPPRASRPFWISFQCRDARRIAAGDHIAAVVHAVLARCAARNIVAVGVNCVDVAVVAQLVAAVRAAVQSFMEAREPPQRWRVETVAYPNSGEVWDGRAWVWPHGRRQCTPREWADMVYNTGAGIVGGCCRVGPEGVAELDALRGPI